MCVPEAKLTDAVTTITSTSVDREHSYTLSGWDADDINCYIDYKVPFSRLRCPAEDENDPFVYLSVIPDTFFNQHPILKSTIRDHHSASHYSAELSDLFLDSAQLASIPLPRLAPFLTSLFSKFIESDYSDYNLASWAQMLIDGVDVDEEWCEKHLSRQKSAVKEYALELVTSKRDRSDYLHPDGPTCHVHSEHEAKLVRLIPGRE